MSDFPLIFQQNHLVRVPLEGIGPNLALFRRLLPGPTYLFFLSPPPRHFESITLLIFSQSYACLMPPTFISGVFLPNPLAQLPLK